MKPKLKENPREWQKFVTVIMVFPIAAAFLLWKTGAVSSAISLAITCAAFAVAITAWIRPAPFRKPYRIGMTASFYVGQVMGTIILTFFFLFILTPLGWALRLCGKDLLNTRSPSASTSNWQSSSNSSRFDRSF